MWVDFMCLVSSRRMRTYLDHHPILTGGCRAGEGNEKNVAYATFVHIRAKLGQENVLRMER